ncbi:ABC transporter permease [Rhodococcus sp. IEGM 1381]|uniref:ABC transporter permease n=1 Tax=Rhodococcus sp. IEGM 1381 TaxID=3047085 RepID=UPI0024B8524A|nr:ABC transporter permease [Rhodococcus sp. IEGM 1381]MDI9894433.1 ABC transporter permease [Rhodococcus sp. IEGM 1381]
MIASPVLRDLGQRLLISVPLLLAVTAGTFVLLYGIGDLAASVAGENADAEQIEAIRRQLGLDRPLPVQYFDWLTGVLHGDFGESLRSGRPVADLLGQRLGATISLALFALILSLLISIPMTLLAARFPGSLLDRGCQFIAVVSMSIPNFFLGLLLVLLFAVQLGVFPASGYAPIGDGVNLWATYMFLPAVTLASGLAGEQIRTFRAALHQELDKEYVRTARAKNVSETSVVAKHAGRNAGLPLITIVGLQIGRLLAGTVLIEIVFGIPGLGSSATDAVLTRDVPVVQAIVLLTAVAVLLASLVVDLAYGILAPHTKARV